jgi:hypothetical protein
VDYEDLCGIINLFDLYIQYANCEGFGLPQVEAAACGVPVMATDYSAMESVIRNLNGTPIKPKALYKELETGCFRAVPDNELAANLIKDFFEKSHDERKALGENTRRLFEKHYTWENSGRMWENYFDSVEVLSEDQTWKSKPRIRQASPKPESLPPNIDYDKLARWLITNVLCEPDKINTFMEARLIRDLLYKNTTAITGGMYFNESSAAFDGKMSRNPFDFNIAYDHMYALCNKRNFWEQRRAERFRL